jgi:hypothetical protein
MHGSHRQAQRTQLGRQRQHAGHDQGGVGTWGTWSTWAAGLWQRVRLLLPGGRRAAAAAAAAASAAAAPAWCVPGARRFPSGLLGQQVVLREGDALYLPPFWLHAVESCAPSCGGAAAAAAAAGTDPGAAGGGSGLSVSLNVFSASAEATVVQQLGGSRLPFGAGVAPGTARCVLLARSYARALLSRIFGKPNSDAAGAVAAAATTAASAVGSEEVALPPAARDFVRRAVTARHGDTRGGAAGDDEAQAEALLGACASDSDHRGRLLPEAERGLVDSCADTNARLLRILPARGVRSVVLADHLEEVAQYAMGNAAAVAPFLQRCITVPA